LYTQIRKRLQKGGSKKTKNGSFFFSSRWSPISFSFMNFFASFSVTGLRDEVVALQKGLDIEIKERKEVAEAFVAQIDDRKSTLHETFTQSTKDRMVLIRPQLDHLQGRFVPLGFSCHLRSSSSFCPSC
jgi:hypothetical protein